MYRYFLKRALPLPDLLAFERYLFVGPHPDDIEIGAGGLVALLKRQKKQVRFIVITDGSSGSQDPQTDAQALTQIRKQECEAAAKLLGAEDIQFLAFPDCGRYEVWDVAKALAPGIVEWNPDVLFAPDPLMPSEIHPDHVRTGQAVQIAALMAAFPLIYQKQVSADLGLDSKKFRMRTLAFYYSHRANQKIHLRKEDFALQTDAIQKHQSQFPEPEDFQLIIRYLKVRGRLFGSLGKHHKEGYFVLGENHQHCFPEVNLY